MTLGTERATRSLPSCKWSLTVICLFMTQTLSDTLCMPDPLLGSQTPLDLLLSSGHFAAGEECRYLSGNQELRGLGTSEEVTPPAQGQGSDAAPEKGQCLRLTMEDDQDGDL